ncbi:MAG: SDR family oxidoreductase [Pseudomonadota bacterium]|nr:SDR family oxidoreductase [Pseudomonadota bacterium]
MRIQGKTCIVTGGAGGIGKAVAKRFIAEGAKGVVIADLHDGPLQAVAAEIGAIGVQTDVASEASIRNLVAVTEEKVGPVDVFFSNAGIARLGDEHVPDAEWTLNWNVHVMAHVYAARAVVPKMVARGGGYLVNTASAAGLLAQVDSATYSVTKHAAVAFAEWLSINYGGDGVRVSCLCPQAVRTPMIGTGEGVASVDGIVEPEELADCLVRTMDAETFLVLPHPQVKDYMQRKAGDVDRWLGGMRRLLAKYRSARG